MSQQDREKWDARYRDAGPDSRPPSDFLLQVAHLLPEHGEALDVAGGMGRNAIWLAQRGLTVTLADISSIGLNLAAESAAEKNVPLTTLCTDLETDPLPPGPWDLVFISFFIRRELFAQVPGVLAPGGVLAVVHPTLTNLQRNPKPPANFLLKDEELPTLISGLEILSYNEGWTKENRHEARLVARKS